MLNIELLAPAGSYASMTAAFHAGADAVYIGGTRFGARAYADNLDAEQMKQAIDYAHIHGKKLFLTVNTLLRDDEMDDLYGYLHPFYEEGLDAVIVQDYGVLSYIRDQFPGMDIHASTQMTVTGVKSSAYLKKLGASRIVTAREMSLNEIRKIHDQVDIEIETFVHGALCFCYSGQCLLSSIIGGRSGNRGRCAQPCRLPYELYEGEKRISNSQDRFLLSPKDMCTIEQIPDLIEAGIYSFKMEGRMKKPEYTAGITSIYRKYIDLYAEKGREGFTVSEEDTQKLMDLYNRGGFTNGYFQKHNGKDMMTMNRPNHLGTQAAKVLSITRDLKLRAMEDLHEKDILEFPGKKDPVDITLDRSVAKGQNFSIRLPKDVSLKKDGILYRTRNQYLIDSLTDSYIKRNPKVKIKGNLILSVGQSAMMTVTCQGHCITRTGDLVQEAQKRPLTMAEVEKQMRKTGQTHMEFESLDIHMDDSVFISMQALNELRRLCISDLEEALIDVKRRDSISKKDLHSFQSDSDQPLSLHASVETEQQFDLVVATLQIRRIYLNFSVFSDAKSVKEHAGDYIVRAHEAGKEIYFITPWIHRQETGRNVLPDLSVLSSFDGILCKSLETFQILKESGYEKPVLADANLYSFNQEARDFLKQEGFCGDTIPYELKYSELMKRGCAGSEMVVYGYLPLMISAQCFRRNIKGCDKKPSLLYLKDRKGVMFPVKNLCGYCCNIIYNSSPLELIDQMKDIRKLSVSSMRLSFTIESAEETGVILQSYVSAFTDHHTLQPVHESFTRGHFKRGVE